jgi:hypothetical protein
MARSKTCLPDEVADGTRYVLEACGQDKSGAVLVQRYVEFPDGNVIMLSERKATPYQTPAQSLSATPPVKSHAILTPCLFDRSI